MEKDLDKMCVLKGLLDGFDSVDNEIVNAVKSILNKNLDNIDDKKLKK